MHPDASMTLPRFEAIGQGDSFRSFFPGPFLRPAAVDATRHRRVESQVGKGRGRIALSKLRMRVGGATLPARLVCFMTPESGLGRSLHVGPPTQNQAWAKHYAIFERSVERAEIRQSVERSVFSRKPWERENDAPQL